VHVATERLTRILPHVESGRVSRVLYGSIIGLALVLTMEAHPTTPAGSIATLLATAIAVGLAELYSEVLGTEARTHERVTRPQVVEFIEDAAAVMSGIAFPALFFLLAVVDVVEYETAFVIAKWSGLGLIGAYGFTAASLTGSSPARALVKGAMVMLVGAFLIIVKALVH
jgi:hypothetical protein